jgi:hypothetical protein
MTTHRFGLCMDWQQDTGFMQRTAKGYQFGENAQTARYALPPKSLETLHQDTLTLRAFCIAKRDEPIHLKDDLK